MPLQEVPKAASASGNSKALTPEAGLAVSENGVVCLIFERDWFFCQSSISRAKASGIPGTMEAHGEKFPASFG